MFYHHEKGTTGKKTEKITVLKKLFKNKRVLF
jgi:hypothetical protein